MKVISHLFQSTSAKVNAARSYKTKPYQNDMVCFTQMHNNKLSFVDRLKMLVGLRPKLNAKSFTSGKPTYKGPYVASRASVQQTNAYIEKDVIGFDSKIVDGFRDGGHNARFTRFGDVRSAEREIITIDRQYDNYLNNVVNYAKKSTKNMSEQEKVESLYNLILEISEDAAKSTEKSIELAKFARGKEVMLGQIFEHNAACCRHKSLLFKILCDEVGLKSSMVRGNLIDMNGFGGHAWNEVQLSNGKKLLIDTQNSRIIDITKPNIKAGTYFDVNNNSLYY